MGISAVGERHDLSTVNHALATMLVFVAVFFYLYGPPITERFTRAANRECNQLVRSDYRSYRLEWHTMSYRGLSRPHWVCYDLQAPEQLGKDMGWWVGL